MQTGPLSPTGMMRQSAIRKAAKESFKESSREAAALFNVGHRTSDLEQPATLNRYDTTRYNVLRGTSREVMPESLKMGRTGANGLHRYDVKPEGFEGNKFRLSDYYMKELHDKKGTTNFTEGPLFIVKGLHNYSNLPSGDERVLRASTTQHEQYPHPVDRAPVPSKFEHLQRAEPIDHDGELGPITMGRTGPKGTQSWSDIQEVIARSGPARPSTALLPARLHAAAAATAATPPPPGKLYPSPRLGLSPLGIRLQSQSG